MPEDFFIARYLQSGEEAIHFLEDLGFEIVVDRWEKSSYCLAILPAGWTIDEANGFNPDYIYDDGGNLRLISHKASFADRAILEVVKTTVGV